MNVILTDTLEIQLTWLQKILGLHGDFKIPVDNIEFISFEPPQRHWLDLRAPGTFMPWVIRAGTYFSRRGKEFWWWTFQTQQTVTIELKSGYYDRIILGLSSTDIFPEDIRSQFRIKKTS